MRYKAKNKMHVTNCQEKLNIYETGSNWANYKEKKKIKAKFYTNSTLQDTNLKFNCS